MNTDIKGRLKVGKGIYLRFKSDWSLGYEYQFSDTISISFVDLYCLDQYLYNFEFLYKANQDIFEAFKEKSPNWLV